VARASGWLRVGAHGGEGGKQIAGVRVLRGVEKITAGTGFDDLAEAHDGDALSELANDGEVMRYEEHGEIVGAAELEEEIEYLGLDGDVEGGGRLVCDKQAGTMDEGHGDENALALATGELRWVVTSAADWVWQGNFMHGGMDSLPNIGAGYMRLMDADSFGDLSADGHHGIERGHRLLEDHGDFAATDGAHRVFRQREKIAASEIYFTADGRVGRKKAQDGERGGGLAGAGLTDEAEDFTGLDVKADVVYSRARATRGCKLDGEIADIEQSRLHVNQSTSARWDGQLEGETIDL